MRLTLLGATVLIGASLDPEHYDRVVAGKAWAAFGVIAAEADVKRGLTTTTINAELAETAEQIISASSADSALNVVSAFT